MKRHLPCSGVCINLYLESGRQQRCSYLRSTECWTEKMAEMTEKSLKASTFKAMKKLKVNFEGSSILF